MPPAAGPLPPTTPAIKRKQRSAGKSEGGLCGKRTQECGKIETRQRARRSILRGRNGSCPLGLRFAPGRQHLLQNLGGSAAGVVDRPLGTADFFGDLANRAAF